MFSARQNWSTVKLGSLTSALARFAVRAGLCSNDTPRLHVYSYVGPCISVDLGAVLIPSLVSYIRSNCALVSDITDRLCPGVGG